jgi:hypothetical protein
MMRVALLLPLILAACVETGAADATRSAVTVITVDGRPVVAEQKRDWPMMGAVVNPATGKSEASQIGTADTVIISGSSDSRDRAIRALAQFCGRDLDPMGFDTQYVYKDPATGDWWFDGFCG